MRMMITGGLLAAICFAAVAADDHATAIADAKAQVERKLRDPGSAQYRDIFVKPAKDGVFVCGEVNAKNAYGGYVGFSPFLVSGTTVMLANDSDATVQALTLQLITSVCVRPVEAEASAPATGSDPS